MIWRWLLVAAGLDLGLCTAVVAADAVLLLQYVGTPARYGAGVRSEPDDRSGSGRERAGVTRPLSLKTSRTYSARLGIFDSPSFGAGPMFTVARVRFVRLIFE